MSPPQQLRQRTSNCSSLLIYRPQKDETLSWPSWLTYSGWFTHVSGHPSATCQAQESESTPAKDRCCTAGPRNQLMDDNNYGYTCNKMNNKQTGTLVQVSTVHVHSQQSSTCSSTLSQISRMPDTNSITELKPLTDTSSYKIHYNTKTIHFETPE